MKRIIGVATGSRAEYGILRPLLRKLTDDPELELKLYVTGGHLCEKHGRTVSEIEADGFAIAERIDMLLEAQSPLAIAKSMGLGTLSFAEVFARNNCDILVILGDRFEMLAVAIAAMTLNIPIAHLHGGELTEGAIDDVIRHSLTQMSHLHFPSSQVYANRILQLGEQPSRVHNVGALCLDGIKSTPNLSLKELSDKLGVPFTNDSFLITFHPVTRELEQTQEYIDSLLAALKNFDQPQIFTAPNCDAYGDKIIRAISTYCADRSNGYLVSHMGAQGYYAAMNHAAIMIGNSSSGVIESAPFKIPVVNIGSRQKGRVRSQNIIDVNPNCADISAGIEQALTMTKISGVEIDSPFGDGTAAQQIISILRSVELDAEFMTKKFVDYPELVART